MRRRLRRYAVTTMIAIVPTAIVATMATNLLAPTEKPPTPYHIIETASIINSPTTIGFADSDLIALSGPDYALDDTEKAAVNQTLDAMKALGVNDVRMGIPWGYIEPVPNGTLGSPCPCWGTTDYIIQQANARGMGVLGVLAVTPLLYGQNPATPGGLPYSAAPDVAAFTAFVTEAAQRYKGQVSAYEVWNEPNSLFGWSPQPDAVAYTQLLKAAYTAIKGPNGVDPTAMVIGGVLVAGVFSSPLTVNPVDYVSTMYANGAKGYFDALSIHPYQYQVEFTQGAGVPYSPLTQLIAIRQLMIDNSDSALRIWATEYGLPTSGPNGVSEQTQATFIKDFLQKWATIEYAGPAFIYTTRDQPGAENTDQGSFGVYTSDWQQKLAAKVILALTGGPTGPPPTDPGAAIGAALNAILQQIANAVAQAYAAAAQQILQAAVTAYVNAIIQGITAALGGLFSGGAVPAAQQQSIVEGVNAARMNVSNLKIEPDASGVASLADIGGSAGVGVKEVDGVTDKTGTTDTVTDKTGTTDTVTDKTGTTDTVTDKTGTTVTDTTGVSDTTGVTDKTGTTDKAGVTDTVTDKTGTTDTVTDTTGVSDKTGVTDKTGTTDKTGVTDTPPVTGNPPATDTTPKSDPPVKKTDPPHPRKWKQGDDGTDVNGAPNAEATNPDAPGIRKRHGSDPGTLWAETPPPVSTPATSGATT